MCIRDRFVRRVKHADLSIATVVITIYFREYGNYLRDLSIFGSMPSPVQYTLINFNKRSCSKTGAYFISSKFSPSVPRDFIILQNCRAAENSSTDIDSTHSLVSVNYLSAKLLLGSQPLVVSELFHSICDITDLQDIFL